eukprot:m.42380 g.42380  ORF g.42380 m.42380 type:complete len:67 (+) comp9877_c0_seq1:315-515(+)
MALRSFSAEMLKWKHSDDRVCIWQAGNGGANQVAVLPDKPFTNQSLPSSSPTLNLTMKAEFNIRLA